MLRLPSGGTQHDAAPAATGPGSRPEGQQLTRLVVSGIWVPALVRSPFTGLREASVGMLRELQHACPVSHVPEETCELLTHSTSCRVHHCRAFTLWF